jgi:hypothetical protein
MKITRKEFISLLVENASYLIESGFTKKDLNTMLLEFKELENIKDFATDKRIKRKALLHSNSINFVNEKAKLSSWLYFNGKNENYFQNGNLLMVFGENDILNNVIIYLLDK